MSALSLRLPNSLHKKLSDLARHKGVSINQLVNSAVAEKMATLLTVEYLQERASRGARKKFEAILAKVPDRQPEVMDRLPNQRQKRSGRKRTPFNLKALGAERTLQRGLARTWLNCKIRHI